MAKQNVEEKLKALARVQAIDSRLDKILMLRGSLPEEVADLEDDVEGLQTRKQKIEDDIKDLELEIAKRNNNIKDFASQIEKFSEQMDKVKNNREYEALSKEIDYANLEIQTSEKKIGQFKEQIEGKKELLAETEEHIKERKGDLKAKQKELEVIVKDTEIEEKKLKKESDKASKNIEDRIMTAYGKIRNNMRNGLAVVSTDRNACGGCFAVIPPQVHLIIRQKKRIVVCENCGRLLVADSFFEEVEGEMA